MGGWKGSEENGYCESSGKKERKKKRLLLGQRWEQVRKRETSVSSWEGKLDFLKWTVHVYCKCIKNVGLSEL